MAIKATRRPRRETIIRAAERALTHTILSVRSDTAPSDTGASSTTSASALTIAGYASISWSPTKNVRVIREDGSLIRELVLDPTRDYQPLGTPTGRPKIGHYVPRQVGTIT
jgi:hypothetical protein